LLGWNTDRVSDLEKLPAMQKLFVRSRDNNFGLRISIAGYMRVFDFFERKV